MHIQQKNIFALLLFQGVNDGVSQFACIQISPL